MCKGLLDSPDWLTWVLTAWDVLSSRPWRLYLSLQPTAHPLHDLHRPHHAVLCTRGHPGGCSGDLPRHTGGAEGAELAAGAWAGLHVLGDGPAAASH